MCAVLYNDIDPKVCEWTKELIADNQIPAGEVVCQSITDITHDLSKFTQCHWFNGLSGWPYALRLAGVPESRPIWTASLPCQSFSSAGKAGGFTDARGQLWEPFFALVRKYHPGCILGEQVEAAIRFGWLDRISGDLESLGYCVGAVILPAAGVGAPHIRHRIYWVAHLPGERRDGQQEAGGQTGRRQSEVGGGDERLAHTAESTEWRRGIQRPGEGVTSPEIGPSDKFVRDCGAGGRLGDPQGGGQREHGSTPGSGGYADEPEQISGMGDLHHQRPQGRSGELGECAGELFAGASSAWSNYDLIPCRDGKFRRVESGSCPLVKRLPSGLVPSGNPSVKEAQNTAEARVMRLRGFGNSICAPLAAEFIKVCMELLPKFTPPPI